MVKKATLAQFIKQGRHEAYEWFNFMPRVTGLRVKEVGSQGEVLISLDDTGWYSPGSWLANYQAQVREELLRELKKAEAVLAPQVMDGLLLQYVKPVTTPDYTRLKDADLATLQNFCANSKLGAADRLLNCVDYLGQFKFNEHNLANNLKELIISNPKK